jgi:hypothetical protein
MIHTCYLEPMRASALTMVLLASSCIVVREPRPLPPGPGPAGYEVMGPVHCSGGRSMHLRAAYIQTPDIAVRVSGGCDLVIENSQVVAGDAAVVISGGGNVRIVNSFIQGSRAALVVSGGARLGLGGSTISGPLQRSGGATIDDQGGNAWQ